MLKKTIKYIDYNDNERTEDFYFNLNKAELTEMELSTSGGMVTMLTRLINEQDQTKIVEIFKKIILKSYGKKTDDGRKFMKSEELSKDFEETEAYSNLFVELSTNAEAAVAFINGIIPKDIAEEAAKESNKSLIMPAA